ncbi:MAG: hypothetical protein WBW84_03910 [Acidobacteriaceae bacterium]
MTAVNLRKYGIGNRKRIARIRWKRREIIHAFILFLLMTAFSIWVAIWIATHKFG